MIDLCLDLETFGRGPSSAIAEIALVGSGENVWLVDDPTGCYDPETVRWWLRQSDAARASLTRGEGIPLRDALAGLSAVLHTLDAHREGECRIWCHATFDIPILASAYRRVGFPLPWHYRNARDLRTLYDLTRGRPVAPSVVEHSALHDARAMAREVRECLR